MENLYSMTLANHQVYSKPVFNNIINIVDIK